MAISLRTSAKLGLALAGFVAASTATSSAVPILQLYIEGATYDSSSDTWVGDFNAGDTIRLWTIGNVAGSGGKGTIYDVKLSVAYDSSDSPTINLASSTTGGYGGFTDPSLANSPSYLQTVTDGSSPLMGDGSSLPSHGIYGSGTSWQEFSLGDFTRTDALGGDFINSLPSPPKSGFDINVYEITVTGTDSVHFDLYDHTVAQNNGRISYHFAPFSHDAEGQGTVPDGGSTLALLGVAMLGVGVMLRKLDRKTA